MSSLKPKIVNQINQIHSYLTEFVEEPDMLRRRLHSLNLAALKFVCQYLNHLPVESSTTRRITKAQYVHELMTWVSPWSCSRSYGYVHSTTSA
jgi:hypothetical protein